LISQTGMTPYAVMTDADEFAVNDRKLPGLERALNDEAMRLLLSSSLFYQRDGGNKILARVRHQVLKHTSGKRCVIEYQLYWDEEQQSLQRIIGKMYRKDRGRAIFENLRHLWHAASDSGARFGMPEPLAYLPEIGMVLQRVVPGQRLADFSDHDDMTQAVRYAAENLAALHGLAVLVGEQKTLDDHIDKYCHPGPKALIEAYPQSAPLVEGLLKGLARDESLHHAPLCPVHGDLGLTQIFITESQAFFIDFDGFCLSHAALDAGNFLVALQVHFGPAGAALTKAFLEGYLKSQSPEMLTGLRVYQAFAYLRRAAICARAPAVADWRQQVRQLLETGNFYLGQSFS